MTKPHILIVEDDPISARLSSNLLAELEADIIVAKNGMEAVALFEARTLIDVVLMDLYLPDVTGFKAAELISETEHFKGRRIPIIALTSNALMESKADFLKSTCFIDYITKPPRKETFAGLVKKHLPMLAPSSALLY